MVFTAMRFALCELILLSLHNVKTLQKHSHHTAMQSCIHAAMQSCIPAKSPFDISNTFSILLSI